MRLIGPRAARVCKGRKDNTDFRLNDEQKMLVELTGRMGREEFAPKAARWDRNHEYPHENVEALRRAGLLGMTIPKNSAARSGR